MLKDYLNYVQNVLGAKSLLLPFDVEEETETSYHFAVEVLGDKEREILTNIIKALKTKKYDILELRLEQGALNPRPDVGPDEEILVVKKTSKSVLMIFGNKAARFLLPKADLVIGDTKVISGIQTLLTHSISDMVVRPELKREVWQHLKAFVHE